jgi:N4-gp56 family major capsid protein
MSNTYLGMKNSTSTSSNTFLNKVVRKVLENFEPNLVFDQFGEAPVDETGSDNVVWAKFPALTFTPAQSELIDGVTPNDQAFTATTITAASKQYGLYVIITDKLKDKALFNVSMIAAGILGDNMARIIDNVIQNEVIDNATKRIYAATTAGGTRAGNRAALTASYFLFTYDIACAASYLASKSAPKRGGTYTGIIHPLVAHWIKTESAAGGRLAIKQYTVPGQTDIYKGEIGMIHGVRMIESANVKTFASTVTVYPTIVFGGMARGSTELQSLRTIIKGFGSAGSADPMDQRMTIAVKKSFAAKILNDDSIVVLESPGVSL